MGKNKKIMFFVLLICLLGTIFIFGKGIFHDGYTISIVNETSTPLKDLQLIYYDGNIISDIPLIESKRFWKDTIDTNTLTTESSIYLTFKDNSNTLIKECIVGYIEPGYTGNSTITISNINTNGKLTIIQN